ncbi:MAG: hypothetical protein ACKPKO_49395, partial [Candidatus Fonsibacter sp.]
MLEYVLPCRESGHPVGDKSSPWERTHGEAFSGKLIPLGAKVMLKPANTKSDSTSEMEPTSMTGVFVGYELMTGYRWSGIYVVWALDDFAHMDVSTKSSALSRRMRRPHKVKVIDRPFEGLGLPLKSEYDRALYALEGVRQKLGQ